MADVDTSGDMVGRWADAIEAGVIAIDTEHMRAGRMVAATLRVLLAERDAAQAQVARMREALRRIAESEPWSGRVAQVQIARAALAECGE